MCKSNCRLTHPSSSVGPAAKQVRATCRCSHHCFESSELVQSSPEHCIVLCGKSARRSLGSIHCLVYWSRGDGAPMLVDLFYIEIGGGDPKNPDGDGIQ